MLPARIFLTNRANNQSILTASSLLADPSHAIPLVLASCCLNPDARHALVHTVAIEAASDCPPIASYIGETADLNAGVRMCTPRRACPLFLSPALLSPGDVTRARSNLAPISRCPRRMDARKFHHEVIRDALREILPLYEREGQSVAATRSRRRGHVKRVAEN